MISGTEHNALLDEIERLKAALKTANANHEHFEREWYLRGDEIEAFKQTIKDLGFQLGMAEEGLANYAQELADLRQAYEYHKGDAERLKTERASAIDRLTPLGCENADLRKQLHDIRNQSMDWAMSCSHDCPACDAMYDLIREAWFERDEPRKAVAGDIGLVSHPTGDDRT